MPDRLTLTVPEAAELLGVSRDHAYRLIRRGEFPVDVVRLGHRLVVPVAALRRLLDSFDAAAPASEAGGCGASPSEGPATAPPPELSVASDNNTRESPR